MSDEDDNQTGMQATFKDLERVNVGNYKDLDIYVDIIGGKQNKLFRSDIEVFVQTVYNVGKELIDAKVINEADLDNLLENMSRINKPQYKNATAYILGYIASGGGGDITKNSAKKALKLITPGKYDYQVEDRSVDCAAIIRYARLWQNIVN
jgi:hypothetical protein